MRAGCPLGEVPAWPAESDSQIRAYLDEVLACLRKRDLEPKGTLELRLHTCTCDGCGAPAVERCGVFLRLTFGEHKVTTEFALPAVGA